MGAPFWPFAEDDTLINSLWTALSGATFATSPDDAMSRSQDQARRLLLWFLIGVTPAPALVALLVGGPWQMVALGSGLATGLTLLTQGREATIARIGVALGMSAQPMMLTAALTGHAWQLDSHMAYFVVLATLVMMADIGALLAAAAIIAVHHLTLTLTLPALVFPGASLLENLGRVGFHGSLVVGQTAALVIAVRSRRIVYAEGLAAQQSAQDAQSRAEAAMAEAKSAATEAERARTEAETAQGEATAARTAAEREAERVRTADAQAREQEAAARARNEQESQARDRMIAELGAGLGALAQGRLTARIDTPFEARFERLRTDFNAAARDLFEAVAGVHGESSLIGSETTEIASSVEMLATRTERQAESLGRIAEGMGALSQRIGTAADSARAARDTAATAQDGAVQTQQTVDKAVTAMGAIEESAGQIERIIGVIDEIAFQTNMLALNAGVEAARAGEAGRGFAVVASEVRALAKRSSDAAAEIAGLISNSGDQIASGVGLVRETGLAINTILSQVGSMAIQVDEIAEAATRQSDTVGEMNGALKDLDGFTQQNAALFEEASAATTTLAGRAQNLARSISRFVDEDDPAQGANNSLRAAS
jgi:methyl-accepting chemotaxis protein